MALNIVMLDYGTDWEVYTFEEGEYRETPKQFKFKSKYPSFNHVDKDMENSFSNDWWGYMYSRTLSVDELKERVVEHYLNVWKRKYEDAEERFNHYNKIKDNLN